jgi:predicted ABC-type ATPase
MSKFIIFAGPNGSGKSTLAELLLQEKLLDSFVNADVIARGLSHVQEESSEISAGKILVKRVEQAISEQQDISFETTLSGKIWKRYAKLAKSKGFQTIIYYVSVANPDLAIERVNKRVLEGGHAVPQDVVRRRFYRSIVNFFNEYVELVDLWYMFDNSEGTARLIARHEQDEDGVEIVNTDLYEHYRRLSQKQ